MTHNYVDKYAEGVFSNSMLDAWEQCAYKAKVLYEERAKITSIYDRVLDSLSLGIAVHEELENHTHKPISATRARAYWLLFTDSSEYTLFFNNYWDAIEETHKEGEKWGKTYTAPTWTSYWKKNFFKLDADKEAISKKIQSENNWLCDINPIDFVLRAETCFANYNKLLPQIDISANPLIEKSLSTEFAGKTVVATLDRTDIIGKRCVISDYKTGSGKYDQHKVQNLNQLNMAKLQLDPNNEMETKFRIIALERGEIIEVDFCPEAFEKYKERLKRQLKYASMMKEVPKEDLPVAAGKSLAMNCPCALATAQGEFKCSLY